MTNLILINTNLNLDRTKLKIYYGSTNKEIVYDKDLQKYFKEFVRFFGFMLGDGWIRKNTGIAFSLGTRLDKSMKYVDFLKNINLDYKIEYEGESRAQCTSSSRYFVHLMEKLDFITGTKNKIVPAWVFKLSNELKREFILGFADADGCDLSETEFNIGGINEKLISDLRILAQQAGLMTTNIVVNKPKSDKNYWGSKTVNNIYGFKFSLKGMDSRFTKNINNNYFEKIRKIELVGVEDVYDIEVDNDLHNFIANGLVAHNCLLQDAMLIHKIMRAPERRIYYVDIGNIPANEVDQHMENIMNNTKKTPYIDENTGQYNLKFNLMNMLEDIYMPVRGDRQGSRIETLPGLQMDFVESLDFLLNQMFAAIRVPKAFLNYDENIEGKCISLDTLIPLLSGETKTVEELIIDYDAGIKNYVYSIDNETMQIVPGEIEWAGKTRLDTQVVEVKLDNNETIICTPDHKFMTRDGSYTEAQNLIARQSLMPLYRKQSEDKKLKDYDMVYNPATEKYEYTHRIVANYFGLKKQGKIIHHADFNRTNNNPDNLDDFLGA